MALLCACFGIALGSALFPAVSIELVVIGAASQAVAVSPFAIGAAAATGQLLGKLVYFLAARGDLRLPRWLPAPQRGPAPQRRQLPRRPAARWHRLRRWIVVRWRWLRLHCHRHPWWVASATAASSVAGIPPIMATTVLAGLAGLPVAGFVLACLPGRFARFTLLAAAPGMFGPWMHLPHLLG